ncbi:MAG: excinuclease ABC subunit UvrC [bacterium]|nr:excinuclease ABC subunit UvrC [bacterium]
MTPLSLLTLREKARALPRQPGVYVFHDAHDRVLYVGKAQSLKHRVAQYFDDGRLEPSKRELMRLATRVDTIVTSNETEALALEATLIQRHAPPYNVRLVDDSSYLYVKITKETYPKVQLVRRVDPDGAWYRGPYPSALSIRRTLKEARKLFPWCSNPPTGKSEVRSRKSDPASGLRPPTSGTKPCFAFHLGLCPGICAGKISLEEYQQHIEGLKRFLDGDVRDALKTLRARMTAVSDAQDYERAATFRDAVAAIERATTPQHAVTPRRESLDALGVARYKTHAVVAILAVREGRIVHARTFHLMTPEDEPAQSVLRGFLVAYLARLADGAPDIVLPEPVEDAPLLAMNAGIRARFSAPRRGWKRRLLDLSRANAEDALARTRTELTSPASLQQALRALATVLRLERPPRRIEGYDVSNIQGVLSTGSMVVFKDGKEDRSSYRKFKIARDGAPDDVAMMKEMLRRRFAKHARGATDEWPLPDLIIVDGGKGQLNAAVNVLTELGVSVSCAALAKREEELYVPGRKEPLILPRTSPGLYLLQRLRDEAHRFTLGYHQLLRKKRMTRSALEEIPGVGAATRKKLLRAFGSLRALRVVSLEELAKIVGSKLAGIIHTALRPPG